MPKKMLFLFLGVVLLSGLAGCGTGGSGIQVRSYVEDKPRVNMEITGNQGYLMGAPPAVDVSDKKKTRKVYVLEITKPADISEEEQNRTSGMNSSAIAETEVSSSEDFLGDIASPEESEAPSFVEYKVEKDDTLQKISKKFYDTYKKWPKIYEANKEKIKDPNHIKPGIVLTIPREQVNK